MQRRIVAHGAVAALVQAQTGGVQEHFADILHQGEPDLIDGAGLRQPGQTILGTEPIHGGLFHDALAVGHGVQLAVQAVSLDGKLTVLGNHIFQRQGLDALIQLFEGAGGEAAQQNHNPLTHAQPQVGLGHGIVAAGEEGTAVFHPYIVQLHPSQLIAHQTFQTEQAGNGKRKFIVHDITNSRKIRFFGYSRTIIFDLYRKRNRKCGICPQSGV